MENINEILAKWDPVGVGEVMARDEYKGYVPMILHFVHNRQKLIKYLEKILVDDMGLNYDHCNIEHFKDVQKVCDDLMQAFQLRLEY